jgi:hypothetical protein
MKFFTYLLLLWVIFAFLDPDSESRSGTTDLIESGSNPDPKYWLNLPRYFLVTGTVLFTCNIGTPSHSSTVPNT